MKSDSLKHRMALEMKSGTIITGNKKIHFMNRFKHTNSGLKHTGFCVYKN